MFWYHNVLLLCCILNEFDDNKDCIWYPCFIEFITFPSKEYDFCGSNKDAINGTLFSFISTSEI